jgi:uncharacterized protein
MASIPILEAVLNDDADAAKSLLNQGADPNTRDPATGLTVLMIAACHARLDLVRMLLGAGADVLTADSRTGATALHKACQGGSVEIAEMLIAHGAFLDAVAPTTGHTPIMDALWYKSPGIVRLLADKGANLNLATHYGFTMMDHLRFELNANALGRERETIVEIDRIIQDRKKADQETIAAQTVMDATTRGDAATAKELIGNGAEVDTVYPIVNTFQDGHTPLLVAARDGHTEIVDGLLKAGAKVRVQDWVFKGSPIHKATYNGKADIVALFLAHPDTDINAQGPINGYTPLHDALWHGNTECARMLIDAGARLDLRGHDGKRPLDIALDVYQPDDPIIEEIRSRMAEGAQRRIPA